MATIGGFPGSFQSQYLPPGYESSFPLTSILLLCAALALIIMKTDIFEGPPGPGPAVCDQGWISSPEKCYFVPTSSEKTSWSEAISRCTSMGAKLVEIQTDEEAAFILRNLPSRVDRSELIYTGRKANDAGNWVFLSNDKMVDTTVRTWYTGEPDGGSQTCGCTRVSDDFLMHDCFCTGFNLFYIENIFTTTTAPRVCDHGWISSPDKCYYVSSEYQKTTWSTAVSRCTSMGAKLVEIQTDEEATFIMRNLPSRVGRSDLVYTGRKANDAGSWVFLSNDKMVDTSVRTWFTGEPDGGSQNCGCARASDDFLMHDCVCTGFNLYYICER